VLPLFSISPAYGQNAINLINPLNPISLFFTILALFKASAN
jgi:hypothetical protein